MPCEACRLATGIRNDNTSGLPRPCEKRSQQNAHFLTLHPRPSKSTFTVLFSVWAWSQNQCFLQAPFLAGSGRFRTRIFMQAPVLEEVSLSLCSVVCKVSHALLHDSSVSFLPAWNQMRLGGEAAADHTSIQSLEAFLCTLL